MCSQPRKPTVPGLIKRRVASRAREEILDVSFLGTLIWSAASSSRSPLEDRHEAVTADPEKGHENDGRAGTPLLAGEVGELGLFILKQRRLWEDFIVAFQYDGGI